MWKENFNDRNLKMRKKLRKKKKEKKGKKKTDTFEITRLFIHTIDR